MRQEPPRLNLGWRTSTPGKVHTELAEVEIDWSPESDYGPSLCVRVVQQGAGAHAALWLDPTDENRIKLANFLRARADALDPRGSACERAARVCLQMRRLPGPHDVSNGIYQELATYDEACTHCALQIMGCEDASTSEAQDVLKRLSEKGRT